MMLKRILVPLDGSPLAEKALRVAAQMARATDGTIVILRVIGVPTTYTPYIYGADMAQNPQLAQDMVDLEQDTAEKYLKDIASVDLLAGIQVDSTIIAGSAGISILDTAQEEKADVIVMCSRGETGFKRFALGSVAQYVSRHSSIPVLVIHGDDQDTFSSSTSTSHPVTALVALDGSELAEAVIEPAAYVVAALTEQNQGTLLLSTVAGCYGGPITGKRGREAEPDNRVDNRREQRCCKCAH
jgi:nucleotide-binding universal stress UspA family protein